MQICKDLRYASTVINVLPRLRLFDSRDVAVLGRTYSRHGTPTRGAAPAGGSRGPPPLPTDASSLDSDFLAAAGQDGEDRAAQEEFDRRLKRAVKEKHAKRGAAAGYSEDEGEDEAEGSEMGSAEKPAQRQRPSSATPARPTSASVRPSLASSLRSHLGEQRRMSPPQRSDPRDIAHTHAARMSASLPGPSSSSAGGGFGRSFLPSERDAGPLSSSLSSYTQSNKAKRASQRIGHVSHWVGHESDVPADTPRREEGAGDERGEIEAEAEEEELPARNRSVSGITVGSPRRSVSPRKDSTLLLDTRAHVLRMKVHPLACSLHRVSLPFPPPSPTPTRHSYSLQ